MIMIINNLCNIIQLLYTIGIIVITIMMYIYIYMSISWRGSIRLRLGKYLQALEAYTTTLVPLWVYI